MSNGKIHNEHYLVSRGDGTNIDVVRITDKLYLVDGVFCMARPGSDMRRAADLDVYVQTANDPLLHYRGAGCGFVIAFNWLVGIQKWNMVELNLDYFDEDIRRCAMEAYDEYRKKRKTG